MEQKSDTGYFDKLLKNSKTASRGISGRHKVGAH